MSCWKNGFEISLDLIGNKHPKITLKVLSTISVLLAIEERPGLLQHWVFLYSRGRVTGKESKRGLPSLLEFTFCLEK